MIDLPLDNLEAVLGHTAVQFSHDLDPVTLHDGQLADIALRLPREWVMRDDPTHSFHDARCQQPLPRDVVSIPTSSSQSLRLYHLELVAEFRRIAMSMVELLRPLRAERGLDDVNLALFLAPAGVITPAHPDRHHNLLLQLAGNRRVWVEALAGEDRVAHHRRLVGYFARPDRGVTALPNATEFALGPGDGLYIPATAFHWTRVEDGPSSMALSVGFSTRATAEETRASRLDVSLRRLGLHPRPSGRMKRAVLAAAGLRHRLRPR